MKKYKMTGCARFFFFLIIFLPAVYFGVSYFNGEDGLQNIKDFIGIEKNEGVKESNSDTKELSTVQKELEDKDELIKILNQKVDNLEKELKQKELELENLKKQSGNQ